MQYPAHWRLNRDDRHCHLPRGLAQSGMEKNMQGTRKYVASCSLIFRVASGDVDRPVAFYTSGFAQYCIDLAL